jgi:non-ribosomal peptide synthase protein (TIGR01720 family)
MVTTHTLEGGSQAEQTAAIEALAAQAQAGLDLENGPLLRAVLFQPEEGEPGRLLLVAHHLVVDAISWRVILEDLYSAYLQFSQGQAIQLPPKTSSFRLWAERLVEHSRSEALEAEMSYWLDSARIQVSSLPVDPLPKPGANTFGSSQTIWSLLAPDQTRQLLQETPAAYHTGPEDLLLAALALGIREWSGASSLLFDLESHGRAELFPDVDLSRTVGWFTSLYPVHLSLAGTPTTVEPGPLQEAAAGEVIKSVKEQLRRVPDRGLGYGLLRYLRGDTELEAQLQAGPQAQVSFNYLGQLDQALPPGAPFRMAQESPGPLHDPSAARRYLIDVTASVIEGQLRIAWTYSQERHRQETIAGIAHACMAALEALIAHCLDPEAGGYTPSDFPDAGIDQESLDRVLAELDWEDESFE